MSDNAHKITFAEFYASMTDGLTTSEIDANFEIKLIDGKFAMITSMMCRDVIVGEYDFATGTAEVP